MAKDNKKDAALVQLGEDMFKELGFYAASNSIKPLYVANGLFRETTGATCYIADIYDWTRGENTKKSLTSQKILEEYSEIILKRQNDKATISELQKIRYYLEKIFNPDSNLQAGVEFSVPNISSIWQVRTYVPAEQHIGEFIFRILSSPLEGKKSRALDIIERALKDDDDDITRTIKPIITLKTENERKTTRQQTDGTIDYVVAPDTVLTIREGFDCLAENCFVKHAGKTRMDSLLALRRMVNYAMFSTFYYLSDINRSKYSGKRVPLLIDAGSGQGAIVSASSKCFTECKKAMESYTVNFVNEWLENANLINDVNSKVDCQKYIREDMNVTDGVRTLLEQHFENNCMAGDKPIVAIAKALQFAMYAVTYADTTPSEFCGVIGTKAGLVGPSGNTNFRRLLINRFLLETIVLSCVTKEQLEAGIELTELGDVLRSKHNIIIGTNTDADYELLNKFGIAKNTPEDLRGSLAVNAQEISNMLISLNLGKKYADGVTIIGRGF